MTQDPFAGPCQRPQPESAHQVLVAGVRDYAIFMLDPGGRVMTWNAGAQRFFGYPQHDIIGSAFSRLYPADTAQASAAHELAQAERQGATESEGWRLRQDGSVFWASAVTNSLRDAAGHLLGFAHVTRDMTERRHQDEALRRSEERFRLLVEGVSDYAIFMLDVNGHVATWNVGAQRIKGYSADEIVGAHFSAFYPADVRDSGWPAHELQVASETGRFVDTGWRLRKDGTRFWAMVTITALRDDGGRLIGFAKLTRDMTDPMRMQAMEQASRQRDEVLDAERDARIAAQHATRMKDEFLATLSHELRTPLASILGWAQVLLRAAPGDARVDLRRGVEVIDRNARAQVQLIDDLLDLSRIMAGKLRLDAQPVLLNDVLQAAVESLSPAAATKDVSLLAALPDERIAVNGDAGRLQQVACNLLNNALKFTPPGGHVRVTLDSVGGHAEFRVSDTGIGIAESFLPLVFERFSQRDSSSSRAHGGLGLGLAICKNLVELHGGSVQAESPGEGLGASFIVRLPRAAKHVRGQPLPPLPAPLAAARAAPPLPRLDGVRVFVVDDEPDARHLVCRILADQGAEVTVFADALQLLASVQSRPPHVIVSDVGLPQMDGHQMLRTLRATEPRDARIPALALSAFTREEDRKLSMQAGFQAHMAKPFNVAELVLQVARLAQR